MDPTKIGKIKLAVKNHFDESPDHYQSFEDNYGFFRDLNEALVSRMRLPEQARILDVGCGTGASCRQIAKSVPGCNVWGLDISSAMIEKAGKLTGESDRVVYVEGDAAKLTDHFDFSFDAIIYSASIFLVPDYEESLRQARDLLGKGGTVGLTFMEGLFDEDGNNAVERAERDGNLGVSLKRPVKSVEFQSVFARMFPDHDSWVEDFRLPDEVIKDFFSVPAMSAGLFPGMGYPARVRKVERLFQLLADSPIVFRWRLMTGNRE